VAYETIKKDIVTTDLKKKMLQELTEKSQEIEQKNRKIQEIQSQYDSTKSYVVELETQKDEFAEELNQADSIISTLKEELQRYKKKATKLKYEKKHLNRMIIAIIQNFQNV